MHFFRDLLGEGTSCRRARDGSLLEDALTAYFAQNLRAEVDAAYTRAYADQPMSTADQWGDLASWHDAMDRTR